VEGQQQPRRHQPDRVQHGQQDGHDDEVALDHDHQPAPVERIGQHPGRQRQQHHRQCAGGCTNGTIVAAFGSLTNNH
jgi:hypothetical protein